MLRGKLSAFYNIGLQAPSNGDLQRPALEANIHAAPRALFFTGHGLFLEQLADRLANPLDSIATDTANTFGQAFKTDTERTGD